MRPIVVKILIVCVSCCILAVIAGFLADTYFPDFAPEIEPFDGIDQWLHVVFQSVFGLMFACFGFLLFVSGLYSLGLKASVQGEILNSKIEQGDDDGTKIFFISSNVRYSVDGKTYFNNAKHDIESEDRQEIKEKFGDYQRGTKVRVYYNPKEPDAMTLLKHRETGRISLLAGLFFLAIALSIFFNLGASLE